VSLENCPYCYWCTAGTHAALAAPAPTGGLAEALERASSALTVHEANRPSRALRAILSDIDAAIWRDRQGSRSAATGALREALKLIASADTQEGDRAHDATLIARDALAELPELPEAHSQWVRLDLNALAGALWGLRPAHLTVGYWPDAVQLADAYLAALAEPK
jgi:hypothetical protein